MKGHIIMDRRYHVYHKERASASAYTCNAQHSAQRKERTDNSSSAPFLMRARWQHPELPWGP